MVGCACVCVCTFIEIYAYVCIRLSFNKNEEVAFFILTVTKIIYISAVFPPK